MTSLAMTYVVLLLLMGENDPECVYQTIIFQTIDWLGVLKRYIKTFDHESMHVFIS